MGFSRQEYWSGWLCPSLGDLPDPGTELASPVSYTVGRFFTHWGTCEALSFLFSSVTQLCSTLCDPMDCSTPGFPVHHQLLELAQTHVHQVSDAMQPSHPLLSPFPPAFNLSQHQGLFQWVSSSHQMAKVSALGSSGGSSQNESVVLLTILFSHVPSTFYFSIQPLLSLRDGILNYRKDVLEYTHWISCMMVKCPAIFSWSSPFKE